MTTWGQVIFPIPASKLIPVCSWMNSLGLRTRSGLEIQTWSQRHTVLKAVSLDEITRSECRQRRKDLRTESWDPPPSVYKEQRGLRGSSQR